MTDEELMSFVARRKETEAYKPSKEEIEENIIEWTTFYRRNLDIFNEDYLGITNLCLMQKQMINKFSDNDVATAICSRGLSKSFNIALTAIDFALLYSGVNILVTSMTLAQSNLIIDEKIDKIFCSKGTRWSSDILVKMREEGYIKFSTDGNTGARVVEFGNGSKIHAVNCGESARGQRSNIAIVDEFCLLKKKDLDEIILATLEVRKFGGRPLDYTEETKQVFLSSARNKTNWGWKHLVNTVNDHYKNKTTKSGFFCGDIFTAVANGIQTKKQYLQRKKSTDALSFEQEYLNIFLSTNDDSIFKYEDFENCQTLEHPFYPRTKEEIIFGDEQTYNFDNDDWIRVVVSDIAVATGNENDNTVLDCFCVNKQTGETRFEHIQTISGMNTQLQAIQIKRLFYEYKADYFIQDVTGVGQGVYDLLTTETIDEEVGKTYPAWTVNTDIELQLSSDTVINDKLVRTISNNAIPVVIPFSGNVGLNSEMHFTTRQMLKDGLVKLLKDDAEMKCKLEEKDPQWISKSSDYKARIMLPFIQTRYTINEAIALNTVFMEGNKIKLKEAKRTDTKDRYMTFAMGCIFASKIKSKYSQEYNDDDLDWDEIELVF